MAIFFEFCINLNVPQSTRAEISDRYKKITQRLNNDFRAINSKTEHSLYVGSYGRGTAVKGFSDLDIIFILPDNLYYTLLSRPYNVQSTLLQTVKKSLQKTYPSTDIGGDGQVVVIRFSDGMKFEIIPAFEHISGGFLYPDSNSGGSWKFTNPRPEIRAIKDGNQFTNNNLINLCRMVRAWRDTWNINMGGLLIDTLAHNFLINWKYKDSSYLYYDWMSRDFFLYLSQQDSYQNYWLAVGSSQYVYRKGNFEYKAKQCYNLALEAIEYESKNNNHSANKKWREIYGTLYPNW